MPPSIFPVVSHTAQTNTRTGIQTVARGLSSGLYQLRSALPVSWHARGSYLHGLKVDWARNLGFVDHPERLPCSWRHPQDWLVWLQSKGRHSHAPLHGHPLFRGALKNAWLILPELMDGDRIRHILKYARRHRMKVAAIFHDAIPILHPDLTQRTAEAHEDYMRALATTDAVLPVSRISAGHFSHYLQEWKVPLPFMQVCSLPGEIPMQPRVFEARSSAHEHIHILCVSTLEPRKNHKALIEAFLKAKAMLPSLTLHLHLAGDHYFAAPEVEEYVTRIVKTEPAIEWHINLEWEQLRGLYALCDFTIYPSYVEGFGLPILESLWFAKPCLCASFGVMAENASGGGCMPVDVCNPQAFANAIRLLASDAILRTRLSAEAAHRPLSTWLDYSREILTLLDNYPAEPR